MNEIALGEFLVIVFVPWIPWLAGAVIALITMLLVIFMFPGFLPSDQQSQQ